MLEASFILNLDIFSAATSYVRETSPSGSNSYIQAQAGLAYTSVGITYATFICIVLFHTYSTLRKTTWWKKMTKMNGKKYRVLMSWNKDNTENETEKSIATGQSTTSPVNKPTSSVVELDELHEPLLLSLTSVDIYTA